MDKDELSLSASVDETEKSRYDNPFDHAYALITNGAYKKQNMAVNDILLPVFKQEGKER